MCAGAGAGVGGCEAGGDRNSEIVWVHVCARRENRVKGANDFFMGGGTLCMCVCV